MKRTEFINFTGVMEIDEGEVFYGGYWKILC